MTQTTATSATIKRPRLWEVDTVRGIAVVLMMFFHFMWDLWMFKLTSADVPGPAWQAFARGIGSTFMFVLGVSLTLDAARPRADSQLMRHLKRGALIFGCGMLVSIGTYAFPDTRSEFVRFGILHLAGAAVILAYPFMRASTWLTTLVGLIIIVAGAAIERVQVGFPWLIPLGFVQRGVGMVDYYPIAPWFGVALLGVAAGKVLYAGGQRQFSLPDFGQLPPVRLLRFLGRHSLPVYLIHQLVFGGLIIAAIYIGLV